jgi:NTP pyrophosphatase (non-canonical NTP hydrolase)
MEICPMPNPDEQHFDHVVFDFRTGALACRHCHGRRSVQMPLSVSVLAELSSEFTVTHANCTPRPGESPTWPHVLAFARRMEAKLEANRHKGNREGWLKDSPFDLFRRLRDEADELGEALRCRSESEVIANEAADVANFAMMIADVVGGLCSVKGEVTPLVAVPSLLSAARSARMRIHDNACIEECCDDCRALAVAITNATGTPP